jgi:hypothetical protein
VVLAGLYFAGGFVASAAGLSPRLVVIPFYACGALLALIFMALLWAGQWRARDLVRLIGPENFAPPEQSNPQTPPRPGA